MMKDPRFPEVKVNLVEEEGWKCWDPAQKKDFWESDAAYEDFRHLGIHDLELYIDDLWESKNARGRKPRRKLTAGELRWLAEQLKDGDEILEEGIRQPIIDAMAWMYEIAAMPERGDIQDAMESAEESLIDSFGLQEDLWEPVLELEGRRLGPKDWRPRKKLEAEGILNELADHIRFEQEEDHYDRYIIFNFRDAPVVHDLMSRSELPEKDLVHKMEAEFDALRQYYLSDFWRALDSVMKDIDISYRADWRASWKSMLSDHTIGTAARTAITKVLKEMPEEENV